MLPPGNPAQPSASDSNPPHSVAVRITNCHGRCDIYHAQTVILKMRQGILRVIENDGGCFVHLDRCSILVKDGENPLFQLNHGPVLGDGNSDLTIIAALKRSA